MNKILLVFLFSVLFVSVSAQKISKPTLTPVADSPEQVALIREGIALHDKKEYDGALRKYDLVLASNPDSTFALYEKAMTLYAKGESEKAIETAVKGSRYRSRELPLFYMTMANVIDDIGKHQEAIRIYRDAIRILKDDRDYNEHLASVHYNLAVTYMRQKMHNEARAELKTAVQINPKYPSPHYLLSEVYIGSGYKVPAFLAAARFISLEFNTLRTERSAKIAAKVLEPAGKDPKTGNIQIFLDMNAPKDEGDFAMYDLLLGTLTTIRDEKEEKKSDEEIFVDAVDTMIAMLGEDKKVRSTFVGKAYIPFVGEMKQKGHSRVFSYLVLYKSGNPNAEKWLTSNESKVADFLNWAKAYAPAAK